MAQTGEATGNKTQSLFDSADLAKMATVVAALAYGTGVVAINSYLHKLGVADFSFAKPKLLLTGTLELSTFGLLAAAPLFHAWSSATQRKKQGDAAGSADMKWPRGIVALGSLALFLLILASGWMCFRLSTPLGEIRNWWIWEWFRPETAAAKVGTSMMLVAALILPVVAAAMAVFWGHRFLMQLSRGDGSKYVARFYVGVCSGFAMLSVFIYVLLFTFIFYPSILRSMGVASRILKVLRWRMSSCANGTRLGFRLRKP